MLEVTEEVEEVEVDTTDDSRIPVRLAVIPEGVETGDGRFLEVGSLTHRDLPLPIMYQRLSSDGHNQSVSIGVIEDLYRNDQNMWVADGFLNPAVPETNEVVDGIVFGNIRGVSADLDNTEYSIDDDGVHRLSKGRIMGATIVAMPAFQESSIVLGHDDTLVASCGCEMAISEEPWDGAASNYTEDQWFDATLIHTNGDSRVKSDNKLPILTPDGALSRAGVHAAAARINQVDADADLIEQAKEALVSAYAELGEEPPASLTASGVVLDEYGLQIDLDVPAVDLTELSEEELAEYDGLSPEEQVQFIKQKGLSEFAPGTRDGRGWLTHPKETQRLRRYWTRGAGAAKIRWGQPGDFNRCRKQLAKYVNPAFLAGTCANLHKVATGTWPGRHRGDKGLVASGAFSVVSRVSSDIPAQYFSNPNFTELTPLTISGDHVYGHLADWSTCHMGIIGKCVTAPRSNTDYAYFHTGVIETDAGLIPVGHLTRGIGHTGAEAPMAAAVAHYDRDDAVWADVVVGEDQFGIWFSGAIRKNISVEERKAILATGTVSGDWRAARGNLELIAAVLVNTPGFPIPRPRYSIVKGEQMSLVASGVIVPESGEVVEEAPPEEETVDLRQLVEEQVHSVLAERDRLAEVGAERQRLLDMISVEDEAEIAEVRAAKEKINGL